MAVLWATTAVVDCSFVDNVAENIGGALSAGEIYIANTLFEGNRTNNAGDQSVPAAARGGAVSIGWGSIENCSFIGNAANNDGYQSNTAPNGGAIAATGPVDIADCVFEENYAEKLGGAVFLSLGAGGSVIANCQFFGNLATYTWPVNKDPNGEGGAIASQAADPDPPVLVNHCIFMGNQASKFAGALLIQEGVMRLNNCLLYDNEAPKGGAVGVSRGPAEHMFGAIEIVNCTLSCNITSGSYGAAIYADEDAVSAYVRNTIVWANVANGIDNTLDSQLYLENRPTLDIDYSLMNGGGVLGVLDVSPRFEATASSDFHLQRSTPARDAGDSSEVDWLIDLDGSDRVMGQNPDLAAC